MSIKDRKLTSCYVISNVTCSFNLTRTRFIFDWTQTLIGGFKGNSEWGRGEEGRGKRGE